MAKQRLSGDLSSMMAAAVSWHKKKKTDSLSVPNCKMYIKPIAGTKVLYFGITKDKISTFVINNSHIFTFVP